MFPNCRPLPGVVALVDRLKELKIPIAVATSSFEEAFKLKIMNNKELFDKFDIIVLGDDPSVKKGKPAPDIFIEAARRLGANLPEDNDKILVLEDAISGVQAGLNAGFKVVWVPDPNIDKNSLQITDEQRQNVTTLNSLEEFDYASFGIH
jgi:HAD superfamily hydrolase (TIGR01509 family)